MSEQEENIMIILKNTIKVLTNLENKIVKDSKIDYFHLKSELNKINEKLNIVTELATIGAGWMRIEVSRK